MHLPRNRHNPFRIAARDLFQYRFRYPRVARDVARPIAAGGINCRPQLWVEPQALASTVVEAFRHGRPVHPTIGH